MAEAGEKSQTGSKPEAVGHGIPSQEVKLAATAGQWPRASDTQALTSEPFAGTRPQVTSLVWVCVTCLALWSSLTTKTLSVEEVLA